MRLRHVEAVGYGVYCRVQVPGVVVHGHGQARGSRTAAASRGQRLTVDRSVLRQPCKDGENEVRIRSVQAGGCRG